MNKASSPGKNLLTDKYLKFQLKSVKLLEKSRLDKAQKQLEGLHQINYKPSIFEIPTLNNLSVVYMKQKMYNKAMVILIKAWIKSKAQGDIESQVGTLFNLSAAAACLGMHAEALNYAIEAMELLYESSNIKLVLISYYNVAVEYINLIKPEKAELYLRKALQLANDNQITDPSLYQTIISALNHIFSSKLQHCEMPLDHIQKPVIMTCRKKSLKKIFSNIEIPSATSGKLKKIEKALHPLKKRNESHSLSKNISTSRKKINKGSNTSSTESLKNSSQHLRLSFSSSKTLHKVLNSEKNSCQSTPLSSNNSVIGHLPGEEFGSRIQHIGDHINTIEKKLNDFVDLCRPLKILTEDPDEQLDSHRTGQCNVAAISVMQRKMRKRFYMKNIAAIKIQRAFRKYRSEKKLGSLLKFKDNRRIIK
ncbi:hypothetical protein SteCoe_19804 [Stentor coeruleus]|uniref:Uncharacterized protein n=1 Tax=Stentor coeruleus TaxID=5963 RepID=A0A1R2BT87_9CILI|nr:hypothetical protein SteCoe_19804 [Stentor coeruleus]